MPQLKMQYQTKNTTSLGNLMQIQSNQPQNLVITPRPITTNPLGSLRGTASLSGLVGRIQGLPSGCKSCGR